MRTGRERDVFSWRVRENCWVGRGVGTEGKVGKTRERRPEGGKEVNGASESGRNWGGFPVG